MKVLLVVRKQLRHVWTEPDHDVVGVASNLSQVKEIIEKSIAARENSQRLESWVHPTILSFSVDEREIGIYNSRTTYRIWDKEQGFINRK